MDTESEMRAPYSEPAQHVAAVPVGAEQVPGLRALHADRAG